jgi:hypothetical protein
MKRILFFLLTAAVCLFGCARSTTMLGSVIVVTSNAENFRLTDVEVAAFPADVMKAFLESKKPEYESNWKHVIDLGVKCSKEPAENCDDQKAEASSRLRSMYFEKMPGTAAAVGKTDSDGKFELTVPRTGRYALVASADVPDDDQYFWIVWVNADESYKTIVLSNHNRLTGQKPDDVLSGH